MPGDLIVLGEVPGYVGATAVVMEVTPVDCKVAILDARISKLCVVVGLCFLSLFLGGSGSR